jgi:hypothetical protein
MSWNTTPPAIFDDEDELQLKLQYAAMVARNERERFTAGYKLFPGEANYGRALQVQAWYFDPIVQDEIGRLRSGDDEDDKPSIDCVKAEVLQQARAATDPKDKAQLYKLYLESEGAIQKGNGGGNVNLQFNDNRVVKVLRVPARDVTPEDDADFDERFYAQQTKLIADARSERPAAAA